LVNYHELARNEADHDAVEAEARFAQPTTTLAIASLTRTSHNDDLYSSLHFNGT
jgi:hypothetical protein